MAPVVSMFSTIFCAVPAFIRVDPESTSGPTSATISISAALPSSDLGLQTTAAVLAPFLRANSTAAMVWGASAGSNADDHVFPGRFAFGHISFAVSTRILTALGSAAQRFFAAGNHILHRLRVSTERRRTFGGVQGSQSPAGRSEERRVG